MLHHPCILGDPQHRGQNQSGPKTWRKCYITLACSGVPNKGDKIKAGTKEGENATSPLHSRGSPTKGTKSKRAPKRAEMLHHHCLLGGPQQRGQNQSGPKRGRKCYITPAFSGIRNTGDKIKAGPKHGGNATSPLHARGSPTKGTKSKRAQKRAKMLHHPYILGDPQQKGQNQSGPQRGRKCYITTAFWGVPNKGDKIKAGPKEGGNATSPLHSQGSPTRRQNQSGHKRGRKCYITPTFSGIPNKRDKIKAGPKEGGNATSPVLSGGSAIKGHNQSGPKRGWKCYKNRAFSGIPNKEDKVKAGPKEGGNATSPLHSRGSPTKGTKSKRAQKRAEMLHHPCLLGGPQQRGENQSGPKRGRKC